jgi:heparan-sulfate lyase
MKSNCSIARQIEMEEGWYSTAYRKKQERPTYAVKCQKGDNESLLFVTVIAPDNDTYKGSIAIVANDTKVDNSLSFDIRVGSKVYRLGYELQ